MFSLCLWSSSALVIVVYSRSKPLSLFFTRRNETSRADAVGKNKNKRTRKGCSDTSHIISMRVLRFVSVVVFYLRRQRAAVSFFIKTRTSRERGCGWERSWSCHVCGFIRRLCLSQGTWFHLSFNKRGERTLGLSGIPLGSVVSPLKIMALFTDFVVQLNRGVKQERCFRGTDKVQTCGGSVWEDPHQSTKPS